jgi:hypothetical protein
VPIINSVQVRDVVGEAIFPEGAQLQLYFFENSCLVYC